MKQKLVEGAIDSLVALTPQLGRRLVATFTYVAVVKRFLISTGYQNTQKHFWLQCNRTAANMSDPEVADSLKFISKTLSENPHMSGVIAYVKGSGGGKSG